MSLRGKKLLLFLGSLLAGGGLMAFALAIPTVYASAYDEYDLRGTTVNLLIKDLTDANGWIGAVIAKSDTPDTITLTTGVIGSLSKCGSKCTSGGCGTNTTDGTFLVANSFYSTYVFLLKEDNSQPARLPGAAFMMSSNPNPGERLTSWTLTTGGGDTGSCLEVVGSETWTFAKYSAWIY